MARRPPQTPGTDQIEFAFEAQTPAPVNEGPTAEEIHLNRKQRRAELLKNRPAPATPAEPAPVAAAPVPAVEKTPAPVPVPPVEKISEPTPPARPVIRTATPKPASRLAIKPADVRQATPFETLLHTELGRIFNFCLRLTQDAARAEDLTQDVFVRAAELLPEATSSAPTPDGLMRNAAELFLKHRRYNRPRRAVAPPAEGNAPPAPAVYELPDAWAGVSDDHRLLLSALGTLDARDRALLVLTDIEGRSYADAGTVLDQSEASVRARVSTARARLHEAVRRIQEQKRP